MLLQGGCGIHQDAQLRSRYNSYLLDVLEALTAKRRVVVRRVVSNMDAVAKVRHWTCGTLLLNQTSAATCKRGREMAQHHDV